MIFLVRLDFVWRFKALRTRCRWPPYSEQEQKRVQPAVAERVRRMEEAGVLTGYRAMVARDRVGLPITAFLRLACGGEKYRAIAALSQNLPEVLECYHVTGEDCFFIKLAVDSLNGLERVVERFRAHGSAIVTIALSCVAEDKPVVLSASEE